MVHAQRKKKKKIIIILTLLSLPVYIAFGYIAPFFMIFGPIAGVVAFFKLAYIDREGLSENRRPAQLLLSLPRGVVVGTAVTVAFFAPMRGLAFLTTKFSDIDRFQELFDHFSAGGIIDAWFGLIGVVFTIPAGFYAWRQGLRIKTQIENIPTSKVHAAALGLAEFKGVARAIENQQERMTEIIVNDETQPAVPNEITDDGTEIPILFERWVKESESQRVIEIRSRFYLEDDSGRILVDPRGVLFWNGRVQFFFPTARCIYLEKRFESGSKRGAYVETRRLNSGDEIYLIGSVEEQTNVALFETDVQRLVVLPSSALKSTNILRRFILGKRKKTSGWDIYDVFFLADIKELNAGKLLTKGIGNIWIWVAGIVCLSVPLLVQYGGNLFSFN